MEAFDASDIKLNETVKLILLQTKCCSQFPLIFFLKELYWYEEPLLEHQPGQHLRIQCTITTVAPWLNLSSWGFYFWIFRASGQYFETLYNSITEFNLQYPNLQIPTAGLKGDLVELNIYGKKSKRKEKYLKNQLEKLLWQTYVPKLAFTVVGP